jgi:hypothetical protein
MVMSPAPIPPRVWPPQAGSLFDRSFDFVPPPGFDPQTAFEADGAFHSFVRHPAQPHRRRIRLHAEPEGDISVQLEYGDMPEATR